ncbi:MAG: hypothetical protein ACOYKM_03145 [Caulobacterales bacterium]|jgi:hypothetical protein
MAPAGELSGVVDQALAQKGLTRTVIAAAPLFFPALAIASQAGALITAPKRLLEAHARRFGLITADPPVAIRPFHVSALRHRRDEKDQMRDWIVQRLRD